MAKKKLIGQKVLYLLWVVVLLMALAIPLGVVPVAAAGDTSDSKPAGYTPVDAAPIQTQGPVEWAVIEQVLPWGTAVNENVLTSMGIPFNVIKTSTLATADLSLYHKIIIAADQTNAAYAVLAANQAKLAAWVAAGGILIAHATDMGWNAGHWANSFLPGLLTHTDFYDNTINITTPHPVLTGISDANLDNWNWSTHGALGGLGAGTKVICDNAGKPTYVQYFYGQGQVLATMQTVEWAYVSPVPPPEAKLLLPNEINYARDCQVKLVPDIAWDVLGGQERYTVVSALPATIPPFINVLQWRFIKGAALDDYSIVAGGQPGDRFVVVQSVSVGELHIFADIDFDGDGIKDKTISAEKKWGEISRTDLKVSYYIDATGQHAATPGQDGSQIAWIENDKRYAGGIILDETVFGTFRYQWGSPDAKLIEHVAGDAIVHWWALDANANVTGISPPNCPADPKVLIDKINLLPRAKGFGFNNNMGQTYAETISGPDGFTTIPLSAFAEGRVLIAVVAEYPVNFHGEHVVCTEFARWNFYTQQLEKVPQVRWAGEEIVLEKYFGKNYAGYLVNFFKEAQSPGSFDTLNGFADTVWTSVGEDGVARASYLCEDQGEVDINAMLYDYVGGTPPGNLGLPINKHGFVVFYIKIEGVTLGNVDGKRLGHDSGLWNPENPWDTSTDMTKETLNVSQDALLRARVKGWFLGGNLSMRPAGWIDTDGNGQQDPYDEQLPAGRWVLPDDWQYLAGPNWQELRPHWDLMDQPNDAINSVTDVNADKMEEVGPYVNGPGAGPLVADKPVIGPYSSLDDYLPPLTGMVVADNTVPGLLRKTIVPNKALNWWDAPMPPAKLLFKITNGVGYFKAADKGDIYYKDAVYYTNPFYKIEVPASPYIPPFLNNGGYDWDSWGWNTLQGPYDFWHIYNYLPNADVPAQDNMHPTKVEVYSDNHGEAMVYLNGNANLKLPADYEAAPGTVVGKSTVKAVADYPYLRKHPSANSNPVEKTWTWGKEIAVRVRQMDADPLRKIIYLYVTDRDGRPVYGEDVDWSFDSAVGLIDKVLTPTGWQTLPGQVRSVTTKTQTPGDKQVAEYLKPEAAPTSGFLKGGSIQDEAKFYDQARHGVTGIMVYRSEPSGVDIRVVLHETEGLIVKDVYLNFAYLSPTDPTVQLKAGMWNEVIFLAPTMSMDRALSSIPKDVDVTIWSSAGQGYNSKAPAWANDMKQFVERVTYYLWVSADCTWIYGN